MLFLVFVSCFRDVEGSRPAAPNLVLGGVSLQYAEVIYMQQYYTIPIATGETALPDFNYLIQYQNNYHAAVMLGIGIIIGCLIALAFLRR